MARYQFSRFAVATVLVLTLAAVAAPVAGAQTTSAASEFVFTRFVAFDDNNSGIAIFNPANREAVVLLDLVDRSGTPIGMTETVRVPALGQVIRTASQLFDLPPEGLDAVLIVRSSVKGLVAYVQTFDDSATYIDGTDSATSSLNLIFPVVPGLSEGESELDFTNPNLRNTAVDLKLWSLSGGLLGKATVTVPGGGTLRGLTSDYFPKSTSFGNASHVTATCRAPNIFTQAQSVIGTSLFVGFYPYIPPGGTVDLAALNAVPLEQTSTVGAIPHFRTGKSYASTLAVVNAEVAASVEVTVTAVGNSGAQLATRRLTIPPSGGYRAPLQVALPNLGTDDREGWLLLQSTGRITSVLLHGTTDQASLTAIRMERTPKLEFIVPQAVSGNYGTTEISISNPGSSSLVADVFVISPTGVTLASNQLSLAAGGHISKNLAQIIPELPELGGGAVFVRANLPVFGSGLVWSPKGITVTSFAPQALNTVYEPAPLTSFAVTGRVTLNDRPAPGFQVILSGPSSGIATTAADGTYMFLNLKPGQYTMTVDQYGFEFFPPQANFELKTVSRRQDFLGSTSTNSIVVQPSAIEAGNGDTTVTIWGRNFDLTSIAYVGNVPLATTFVAATQLTAVIPAYMVADPDRFEIVVSTESAPGQVRTSQPFGMVAFQDQPTVSAIVTASPILEGSPAVVLTVRGSGFLEGALIRINGSSDEIEITSLKETEIVAVVPPRYFEVGGVYPLAVENPYPANVQSNIQLLVVYNPVPVVEAVSPSVVAARLETGAGPLTIEVFGYGFRRGAVVLFNNQPLSTTYCESDRYCLNVQLYATVPAALLRQSGFANIQVRNADPAVAGSETVFLRIEGLVPTITSVVPGSGSVTNTSPTQYSIPVVVYGTNFGPQTSVRIYKSDAVQPPGFSPPIVLSTNQLYVNVTITYPNSIGDWIVEVANPQPGGGKSQPAYFTISEGSFAANPFIVSMTPEYVAANGPGFTLVINGNNFQPGSTVMFMGRPLTTTFVSDRQVQANVPASLLVNPGRVPITVLNPDSGGASNRVFPEIR